MGNGGSGFLNRLGQRLTETLESADASELSKVAHDEGADKAVECRCGQVVELFGRIRSVTYGSEESELGVCAEIFDGTAPVTVMWMGRRSIPGIEVGRYLHVKGRLATRAGVRVVYNPRYELREFSV